MERPVRSMYMDIQQREALGVDLYRVTIAASEKVRQPPQLDFGGLNTDSYSRNPVVMWAHDAVGRSPSGGLPIGRTLNLTRSPEGRIVADFEFLGDDPFAQRVKNAWDKGFLRAASISWIPLKSVPVDGTWRDTRSDLLEWSIVSVPADPDALRESHRRLMDDFLQGPAPDAVVEPPQRPESSTPVAIQRHSAQGGMGHAGASLALSPDEYDDLTAALALLRDVVDGVQQAGTGVGKADSTREITELGQGDLLEIQAMVRSIRNGLGSRGDGSPGPAE